MERASRILELLYDRREGWCSGEELASAAGVTPRGLQRALEALRQRGHDLEVSPAQGVRLVGPIRLDARLLERGLGRGRLGHEAICFDEVGSTNDVAFDSARQGAGALVVTAEHQRGGRGRLGRRWFSRPRSGILASVLLPGSSALPHDALTIAAGLAVAEGIEQAAGVAAALDWPNDVVLHGAKLAGVLVEVRKVGPLRRTVIGLGINVFAAPSRREARRATTCLAEASDRADLDRIQILRAVLDRLDHWLGALRDGKTAVLHRQWCARCGMLNRRIRVETRAPGHVGRLAGRVLDVDPLEGLALQTDQGTVVHLSAATSTVLG